MGSTHLGSVKGFSAFLPSKFIYFTQMHNLGNPASKPLLSPVRLIFMSHYTWVSCICDYCFMEKKPNKQTKTTNKHINKKYHYCH